MYLPIARDTAGRRRTRQHFDEAWWCGLRPIGHPRLAPSGAHVHAELGDEVGDAVEHLLELGVRDALVAVNVGCRGEGGTRANEQRVSERRQQLDSGG